MLIEKKNRDQRKIGKQRRIEINEEIKLNGVFCFDTILEIACSNINKEKERLGRERERERDL